MHPFRNLLLISVGRADSLEKVLTPGEWSRMFQMARHQSLLAIIYEAVLRLPEQQRPPQEMMDKWKEYSDLTAGIYNRHQNHIEQLKLILDKMGLRGCILKGTGLSHLYPTKAVATQSWPQKPAGGFHCCSWTREKLVGSGGGEEETKMGVWKRTTVKHARIFNKSWRFLHDDEERVLGRDQVSSHKAAPLCHPQAPMSPSSSMPQLPERTE